MGVVMQDCITRLARTFQSTRTRRRREQYMPLVAFCLRHFLTDFIICMCEFDFRQAQPSWIRNQPSRLPLMSALIMPVATSLQYECVHVIPRRPTFAPRFMKPFRASRFKSSLNPSCRQTRSRGRDIQASLSLNANSRSL